MLTLSFPLLPNIPELIEIKLRKYFRLLTKLCQRSLNKGRIPERHRRGIPAYRQEPACSQIPSSRQLQSLLLVRTPKCYFYPSYSPEHKCSKEKKHRNTPTQVSVSKLQNGKSSSWLSNSVAYSLVCAHDNRFHRCFVLVEFQYTMDRPKQPA